MAIYDFECHACHAIFEKLVRIDTQVTCDKCWSSDVVKIISAPRESGVVLKGEGFYKPSKSSW